MVEHANPMRTNVALSANMIPSASDSQCTIIMEQHISGSLSSQLPGILAGELEGGGDQAKAGGKDW